jgi:hypothetical protein
MTSTGTRGLAAMAGAVMLLIAAGCGSSSKTTTAPNTPAQIAADKAIAKQAVLKPGDLPGYTATPHKDSSGDAPEPVLRTFAKCAKVPQAQIADFINSNDPKQPDVDSPDFKLLDTSKGVSTSFENNVALDRSSKHIGEQFDILAAKSTLKCWKDFFRAAVQSSSDKSVSVRGLTVVSPSMAKIGDQSAVIGVRATFVRSDGFTIKAYIDFYLVRIGRAAITLLATGIGERADSSLAQSLVKTVADRLKGAT